MYSVRDMLFSIIALLKSLAFRSMRVAITIIIEIDSNLMAIKLNSIRLIQSRS